MLKHDTRPTAKLIPSEYNPRTITRHDMDALVASLKAFGFVEPIVINKNNHIIGGHQRWQAAKQLGLTDVPVVVVDLPPEKEKALNLALNRIHGDWDDEKLTAVLSELAKLPDVALAGFSQKEIDDLLAKLQPPERPEVEFTQELLESHNYVVLYFDNDLSWLQFQSVYPLKTVKGLRSAPGYEKKGVGRVINGEDFLNKILPQ